MKRLFNLFLAALLAFAPVAKADLRASSGAFGPIAATSGSISTAVTGVVTLLAQSAVGVSAPSDANEDTLATITVPPNTIGANGLLRITTVWTTTSSANTKTLRIRYSGASGTTYMTQAFGATTGVMSVTTIANRNATNSQVGASSGTSAAGGVAATATQTSAVDTTGSSTVVITCQKALNTEACTLESFTAEVIH